MSEQKPITNVPDGQMRFYTTRQKPANEKDFVGYETVWKPFQKEVEYKAQDAVSVTRTPDGPRPETLHFGRAARIGRQALTGLVRDLHRRAVSAAGQ